MQNFTKLLCTTLKNFAKYKLLSLLAVLAMGVLFYIIGYLTSRADFIQFFGCYLLLFGLFYWLTLNRQGFSFKHFFFIAIGLRVILLFSMPELSNDFHRFFWDGELILKGINPYAHTPNELISYQGFFDETYMRLLYHGMGELSQEHYSCYPPLNQLFFTIPALFSDSVITNLIVLKLILILVDVGIILIGKKILEKLNLNINQIWLFALNPFIILEFTGNVHFEGVMIFFLLCAFYLIITDRWLIAAIFLACAIHIKLIPLILIPVFFKKLKWRATIGFIAMTTITVLLIGKLFLNELFLANMMTSINDYFVSFEFNASIYYILREIGFSLKGYNMIASIGPTLSLLTFFGILLLVLLRSFQKNHDLFTVSLFVLLIYYGFSTTVHPWYISMILIVSIFTKYRFGLIWSFLVMLSYSAYTSETFQENYALLITQYAILFSVVFYEIYRYWQKGLISLNLKSFFSSKNE